MTEDRSNNRAIADRQSSALGFECNRHQSLSGGQPLANIAARTPMRKSFGNASFV